MLQAERRSQREICPSARDGIDVATMIKEFCDSDFYKEDYQAITSYFADDMVEYQDTITQMREIADLIENYKNCM